MPFSFLQPIFLYGLIATSIPLLIHLLNRRRLKTIRFPAVRFILLSQRRIKRNFRLRHWLILALRTCAVLILIMILAHPFYQSGVGLFAGGAPLSSVIVLDNSLSMKLNQEGEDYSQAKETARVLISSLREADQAALIPTNALNGQRIRIKGDKKALLRGLDDIPVSAGTADFSFALRKAYELLKEPSGQKAIWLITDMAQTGWNLLALSSMGEYDPQIPLKIIKVGKKWGAPKCYDQRDKDPGTRSCGGSTHSPRCRHCQLQQ